MTRKTTYFVYIFSRTNSQWRSIAVHTMKAVAQLTVGLGTSWFVRKPMLSPATSYPFETVINVSDKTCNQAYEARDIVGSPFGALSKSQTTSKAIADSYKSAVRRLAKAESKSVSLFYDYCISGMTA